jgi:site-specific recombinase XerD
VPLGDEVLSVLKAHRHLKGATVFCNEDGSMLTAAQCRQPLEAACRKAGLAKRGWHALRHSFASHLAMRGASAKEVQELLGHGSLQMTMRYMHLSPQARRDAVRLLDDLPSDAKSRHKEGT